MSVDLLTIAQTLERTGLARRTFYRLRDRGEFPDPVRVGHALAVLFRRDQVDAWLQQRGIACKPMRS